MAGSVEGPKIFGSYGLRTACCSSPQSERGTTMAKPKRTQSPGARNRSIRLGPLGNHLDHITGRNFTIAGDGCAPLASFSPSFNLVSLITKLDLKWLNTKLK